METIFPIITKKVMFLQMNDVLQTLLLFENLMNDVTSHLTSLLCKSPVSKYVMVGSVINEIIKKN